MSLPTDRKKRLVFSGQRASIEYAYRSCTSSESYEWIWALSEQKRAGFGTLFERLGNDGRISNQTQFRQLNEEVWEFKRYGQRLFCVRLGSRVLLTHGKKKDNKRKIGAEVAHARLIASEHYELEKHDKKRNK